MTAPAMKIAHLDRSRLRKLHEMEQELGTVLVALEVEFPVAKLSARSLGKIQAMEKELGLVLVAYRKP